MKAFDRNDYRRFDHVGSDSDEDSAEENYPVDSIEEIIRKAAHLQGLPAPDSASMSWNAGGHVSDRVSPPSRSQLSSLGLLRSGHLGGATRSL